MFKIIILFILLVILGASSACAPNIPPGTPTNVPAGYPAPGKTPTSEAYPAHPPKGLPSPGGITIPSYPGVPTISPPVVSSPTPQKKGGEEIVRGPIFIDRTEIIRATTGTNEHLIRLAGNKPTPCHEVQYKINQPDKNNKIQVDIYTTVKPGQFCAQVLAPFNLSIEISKLSAGNYSVFINEEKAGEIKIDR